MLFIYSLLGFFMVFFALFAIREVIDQKNKSRFMVYTVLASVCGGGALLLILSGVL